MEKKALLRLLVILLALSYVVFVTAVPATRSLVTKKVDPSVQDHQANKEALELKNSEEMFDMEEGAEVRRMMMEVSDYSEPRPNPAHHPKPPGKPNNKA